MKKSILKTIFLLFIIQFTISSCSKQKENSPIDNSIPEGYALIKIDLPEILLQEEDLDNGKNGNTKIISSNEKISVHGGFQCDVKLEPVGTAKGIENSLKELRKKAETKQQPVSNGVRYRIYIFEKESGALVDSASYTRGSESTKSPIKIVGGKDYTIIAYSNNSTTEFPAYLEQKMNIRTAEITNKNVDFMFHKQDISIGKQSTNTLKIKFRHMFSQITTTIRLDASTSAYSYIRNISSPNFVNPSYEVTKFKVSDQTITGLKQSAQGAPVTFPTISESNTSIKSITTLKPTIIYSPITGSKGKMIIEAMTIGGVTRGNIVIDDLKLTPGVKYNLILTFHVPETVELGENPYFKYYDNSNTGGKTYFDHEVKLINPTYGAQLDIFYLDNSFQLFVNDKPVFSKELNFEDVLGSDVKFTDGTWYGSPSSGTAVIYNINRTAPRKEIPIVRLVIDENGQIQLFGRKNLNESLRILNFRNGVTYTPVKFNPNGTNTIKFRSHNWNITDVWGRLYGIRIK